MKIQICVASLCLLLSLPPAQAAAAGGQPGAGSMALDMPEQSLEEALAQLAMKANLNLVYYTPLVGSRKVPALKAEMTVDQAFTRLLAGTGLEHRFLDGRTLMVFVSGDTAAKSTVNSSAADTAPEIAPAAQSEKTQADTTGLGDIADITEIVVTGSHIRGLSSPTSPVLVFDRTDIERTGVASVQQFFEKLPQNTGSGANPSNTATQGPDRGIASNEARGASINLRGLGTGSTLTLINGRRITASNQFQYVDISLLPLSAIERIEVLTDGASALYGSDAVGGVVNIVLRKGFEGYETQLRYGGVTTGGLKEMQAAQTGGWGWESGSALLSYEYFSQDNLLASEKEFARNAVLQPYDLYPESRRHSAYGAFSQKIGPALTLELTGIYAARDVHTVATTASGFDTDTPDTTQYDLSAGATLDLPDGWQARFTGAYGKSAVESRVDRTTSAGAPGGTFVRKVSSDSWYVDLIADGTLFPLPAGSVRAAIGATRREDTYDYEFQPSVAVDDARTVTSVFAETNIPIVGADNRIPGVKELVATAAVRYDRYDDFGSSTNPKFGLAWETVPGLTLRGSYGTSFRAPNFQDMSEGINFAGLYYLREAAAPGGRTLTMQLSGGNAGLGPESSTTWTAGIDVRPTALPEFSLRLGYYNILYEDRIDPGFTGSTATIFNDVTAIAPILIRNPAAAQIDAARAMGEVNGGFRIFRTGQFAVPAALDESDATAIIDNRLRNNARTSQDGVDFDVDYRFDARGGRIGLRLAAQYILDATRQITVTSAPVDAINLPFLPADLKVRAGADFARGAWSAAFFVNHAAGYTDPANIADTSVEAWNTVDLHIRYDFAQDLDVALSLQNAFDEDPPYVVTTRGAGFDPANANPLGRFIAANIAKKW